MREDLQPILEAAGGLCLFERHSRQLEELDAEGILAFAKRVLPRAGDHWAQASLEQRQRFQQLFFPNGITFDGNCFVRAGELPLRSAICRRSRPQMKVW
jgi:hypothetical protein